MATPTPSFSASAPERAQTKILAARTDSGHTVRELVAAWLGSFTESAATRAAYGRDLAEYLDWCVRRALDPLTLRLPEVQLYAAELAVATQPRTGRSYAASTRARKLAAVSSWYTFLVRAGALDANPARDAARPRYDRRHSPTASVSTSQATAMLTAAPTAAYRTLSPECASVIMMLLVSLGIRVSELCHADLGDLGHRDGHRVLTVRMKGGTTRTRPIPAPLEAVLETYLAARPRHGDPRALVVTTTGARINRFQVHRLVQRLAAVAGVPTPRRITAHALRHTFNTIAREHGAALEDRRDALGHSSAAITQLYDHVALSITRDPAHLVAAATHHGPHDASAGESNTPAPTTTG